MNKIDKIIKQGFYAKSNQKVDLSAKIMKKIEDYEYKKENLRFKVINYFLSFATIVLSIISIYIIEILLPDFKIYLNVIKIDYFLTKFVFQGFFAFFIITILSVSLYNLTKRIKIYHIKIKNLLI